MRILISRVDLNSMGGDQRSRTLENLVCRGAHGAPGGASNVENSKEDVKMKSLTRGGALRAP